MDFLLGRQTSSQHSSENNTVDFDHSVLRMYWKFMVCTAHRPQCKTPHFTEHKFPVCAAHAPEINCNTS